MHTKKGATALPSLLKKVVVRNLPWPANNGGGGQVNAPYQVKADFLACILCLLPRAHLLCAPRTAVLAGNAPCSQMPL